MRGSRPLVLLAVLSLVVSSVTLAGVSAGSTAAPAGETDGTLHQTTVSSPTPNVTWKLGLAPQAIERIGDARHGLDIGATMVRSNDRIADRLAAHSLSVRLEEASSDEQRFDILVNESKRVDRRITQLRREERTAITAYNAGDIGTETFVTRLARVHAWADHLQTRIDGIREGGEAIQSASVIARADELEVAVTALRGPIRERIIGINRGETTAVQVYAETSTQGVVLATIMDDTYVREAYHSGRRVSEGPTISLQDAITVFSSIYPAAFSNVDDMQAGGQRSAGIYYVTLTTNDHEEIQSFLDNRNRTVFKEFYRQPRTWIEFSPAVSVSGNGTVVRINRTYPSGPMRITALDGETGDPIRATVIIDGSTVGRTSPYGTLWTIEHRGPDQVSVVRQDGRSVNVTLSPPTNPPGDGMAGGGSDGEGGASEKFLTSARLATL